MSFRIFVFVAALGCLAGIPLTAQQPNHSVVSPKTIQDGDDEGIHTSEQDTTVEIHLPPNLIPALQGIEAAIRDLVAKQNIPESVEEIDRAERDLVAQEDMAWWAAAMFFATVISVLVTAVGVYLVGKTLGATKEAGNYAKLAASHAESAAKAGWEAVKQSEIASIATQDAASTARAALDLQQRPWLSFQAGSDCKITRQPDGRASFALDIKIENISNVLAHYIIALDFVDNEQEEIKSGPKSDQARRDIIDKVNAMVLFPGESKTMIYGSSRIPFRLDSSSPNALDNEDNILECEDLLVRGEIFITVVYCGSSSERVYETGRSGDWHIEIQKDEWLNQTWWNKDIQFFQRDITTAT